MLTLKTKLLAVGGAALALLLFGAGRASADDKKPKSPPVPTGTRATVVPNDQGGMVLRTEASTRGGDATLIAPRGAPVHAYNGQTVMVLETGLLDADKVTGGEWWRVATSGGGTGYSRAVDPQGVANYRIVDPTAVTAGNEAALYQPNAPLKG